VIHTFGIVGKPWAIGHVGSFAWSADFVINDSAIGKQQPFNLMELSAISQKRKTPAVTLG
jgi:hypothetical protein